MNSSSIEAIVPAASDNSSVLLAAEERIRALYTRVSGVCRRRRADDWCTPSVPSDRECAQCIRWWAAGVQPVRSLFSAFFVPESFESYGGSCKLCIMWTMYVDIVLRCFDPSWRSCFNCCGWPGLWHCSNTGVDTSRPRALEQDRASSFVNGRFSPEALAPFLRRGAQAGCGGKAPPRVFLFFAQRCTACKEWQERSKKLSVRVSCCLL